jgi:hypothetical protein
MRQVRALGVATATVGAVLAVGAPAVGRWVSGRGTAPPTWLVRLLGARLLVQGLLEIARPDHRLLLAAAAADGTHAASMVAAALQWPQYRRAALVSGGLAVALGTTEAVVAGNQ